MEPDLTLWCGYLKIMPKSIRRALKRLLITKEGRDKVSDALELEVFPNSPWHNLDSNFNPPKEWQDGN